MFSHSFCTAVNATVFLCPLPVCWGLEKAKYKSGLGGEGLKIQDASAASPCDGEPAEFVLSFSFLMPLSKEKRTSMEEFHGVWITLPAVIKCYLAK